MNSAARPSRSLSLLMGVSPNGEDAAPDGAGPAWNPRPTGPMLVGPNGEERIPGLSRAVFHRGAKFDFERVEFPGAGVGVGLGSGAVLTREVIRHPGSVVVLPLVGEPARSAVLIASRRPALDGWIWELPAGTRDREEDPEACAVRELKEETGCTPGSMVFLGSFFTSPGLSDEFMHAFAALDCAMGVQALEADESIAVHVLTLDKVARLVERGELADAKSLTALYLAERRGLVRVARD